MGLGVANDEPDQNDTMGRVLRFRSRGETAARLIPRVLSQNTRDIEGSPIGDLAKYEQAGDGELVDREVFVVANEHLPPDASEHLGGLARQRAPSRRILIAPADARFAIAYK